MKAVTGKMIAVAAFGLFACFGNAMASDGPVGKWIISTGKVTIQISDCGTDNLCGTIVALSKPLDKTTGKPKLDKLNPDPAKRTQPVIGTQVFSSMKKAGSNKWVGKIYNADDGSTYRATSVLEKDRLLVQACWGLFCKKTKFKRVE